MKLTDVFTIREFLCFMHLLSFHAVLQVDTQVLFERFFSKFTLNLLTYLYSASIACQQPD